MHPSLLRSESVDLEQLSTKGSSTLIVFDWDDTILPTYWLEKQRALISGAAALRVSQLKMLKNYADIVQRTIEIAIKHG